MKPLLLDKNPSQREVIFYNNDDALYVVRDNEFKYQAERPYSYGGAEIGATG